MRSRSSCRCERRCRRSHEGNARDRTTTTQRPDPAEPGAVPRQPASLGPADVGGDRRAALGPGLPAGLPPHRQPARRRGPHARRVHPRLPLAALLPAGHLRGLAAPHHHQRVPRQDAPQAADPLRRPLRRRRRAAAQPRRRPGAALRPTPTSTTTSSARWTRSPPDFRAAVVLCDIEGLSYEEIAATLDVKLGTVRSRIHRGRAQLREALAHRAPDPARTTTSAAPGPARVQHRAGRAGDPVTVAGRRPPARQPPGVAGQRVRRPRPARWRPARLRPAPGGLRLVPRRGRGGAAAAGVHAPRHDSLPLQLPAVRAARPGGDRRHRRCAAAPAGGRPGGAGPAPVPRAGSGAGRSGRRGLRRRRAQPRGGRRRRLGRGTDGAELAGRAAARGRHDGPGAAAGRRARWSQVPSLACRAGRRRAVRPRLAGSSSSRPAPPPSPRARARLAHFPHE